MADRSDARPPTPVSFAIGVVIAIGGFLFVLACILGGIEIANIHSQDVTRHTEQVQGERELQAICHTLDRIAALQPPPGNPNTNPSRCYEQEFHTTIDQLRPDLGCQHVPS